MARALRRVPTAVATLLVGIVVCVELTGCGAATPQAPPGRSQAAQPTAARNPPADHTKDRKGVRHKSGSKQAVANCGPCHGPDLRGGKGPSCYACHGQEWH